MEKKLNAKKILSDAKENHYAVGAFNVANIETLKAIVQAAVKMRSPIIVEASAGEVHHVGIPELKAVVEASSEETGIPILLNLDHSGSEEDIQNSIDFGFDLIHIDGSKLSYEENLLFTKRNAVKVHAAGLLCEGELDHIQGSSDDHRNTEIDVASNMKHYTDPDKAATFVEESGVDIFAAFFGNVHGLYQKAPVLDFDRLVEISAKVDAFLSLHGGSGIKDEDVRKAIKVGGIAKVNVNSEMRIAFREGLEESLASSNTVKPYEYYQLPIERVQRIVEDKIRVFGSEGKA